MDKKLLEQLAARAEQKEKDRLEVKTFSVGGVDMLFHKPAQADQLDYVEAINEASGARDSVAGAVDRPAAGQRRGTKPRRAAGGRRKKLIERDPLLDLAAFYAPRGITPEEVRRMSLTDRAVLRVGRARYYEETRLVTAWGIASAFPAEEKKEGAHGEK